MPAIELDALTVRYGDLVAVDRLSFTADAGKVTAVLGPNGAGKSSTIETLEGYRRPTAGRVRVLGLDPVADHATLVTRIGVMLQDGGVYPGIRAREMVRLLCELHRRPAGEGDVLLERVGLAGRARATWRQLSGGEQRRLALACALAGRPAVAFLDEPTSGVDVAGRQLVRGLLRDLAADGCTVLVTTHELDEAEKVADHVVIIDRGRLVAEGSPAELRRAAGGEEIRFGAAPGLDVAGLAATLGAPVAETSPGEYRVAAVASPANVAAITAWLAERDQPLADLRAGRHRLEDVFVRLTGGDGGEGPGAPATAGGRRRGRRR